MIIILTVYFIFCRLKMNSVMVSVFIFDKVEHLMSWFFLRQDIVPQSPRLLKPCLGHPVKHPLHPSCASLWTSKDSLHVLEIQLIRNIEFCVISKAEHFKLYSLEKNFGLQFIKYKKYAYEKYGFYMKTANSKIGFLLILSYVFNSTYFNVGVNRGPFIYTSGK